MTDRSAPPDRHGGHRRGGMARTRPRAPTHGRRTRPPSGCCVHTNDEPGRRSPEATSIAIEVGDIGDRDVARPAVRRSRLRRDRRRGPHRRRHPPDEGRRLLPRSTRTGTRNVVDRARRGGVRRVVHVSSNSPFGTNPHPADLFRHDEPYHPYLGYGRSKMEGELAVFAAVDARASNATDGAPAVVLRPVPAAPTDHVLPHGARRASSRSSAAVASAARWCTSTTSSTASLAPSSPPRPSARATGSPTNARTRSPRSSRRSVDALRDEGFDGEADGGMRLPAIAGRSPRLGDTLVAARRHVPAAAPRAR